jgi:hypothetical protein
MKKLLFPIVLLAAACAYQPNPQSDVFKGDFGAFNAGQIVQNLAETQAPFDMDCPTEELTFKALAGWRSVGVTGCGNRATYKWVNGVGWVMNTTTQESAK